MDEVVDDVKAIKYAIRKYIGLIREIFDADVCYLYLINNSMDNYEKETCLRERIADIKKAYSERSERLHKELETYDVNNLTVDKAEVLETIDILKFIDIAEKEKKWNYDCDNRPKKYVIFKDYNKGEKIFSEGLTAYIARTCEEPLILNNASEIEEHDSSAFLNSKSRIAPNCSMMIGFPLIDHETGKTIGVLKIENYYVVNKYNYNSDSKEVIETRNCLPLLIRLIISARRSFNKNSYEKLFRGMKLLENLKGIQPTEKTNSDIHEATLHLFLVLKRKEYVGYEDILDRITKYASKVSQYLGLNKEIMSTFYNSLERVRKHEELLLYGLNNYRDHFVHQFHVFVSGYIIINELGIEVFRSKIQDSMNYILGYENKEKLEISESDVLRIWFLTAFYHDYAYILEKIDDELSNFFYQVLGYPFSVKFNWEQLLTKESTFPEHLNNLVRFFASPKGTNQDILLRNYLDSIIRSHDHGVLSALLLINHNLGESMTRINECLYAALAISLHNKTAYEELTEDHKTRISFESFPIAFLLSFCDTAQSFGRLTTKNSVKSTSYPVMLSGIDIVNQNKVTYKLKYLSNQPNDTPTGRNIKEWAKGINDVFKSEMYFFEISYYKYNEELIHTLDFY